MDGMTLTIRLTTALAMMGLLFIAAQTTLSASHTYAQIFQGPGLIEGVNIADNVSDLPNANDPHRTIGNWLTAILNFVALIAVIMIIIAGFYLVLSLGEDEKKDKAKKIIFYTLIGLIVLLFARIIVGLVTVVLYDALP